MDLTCMSIENAQKFYDATKIVVECDADRMILAATKKTAAVKEQTAGDEKLRELSGHIYHTGKPVTMQEFRIIRPNVASRIHWYMKLFHRIFGRMPVWTSSAKTVHFSEPQA